MIQNWLKNVWQLKFNSKIQIDVLILKLYKKLIILVFFFLILLQVIESLMKVSTIDWAENLALRIKKVLRTLDQRMDGKYSSQWQCLQAFCL